MLLTVSVSMFYVAYLLVPFFPSSVLISPLIIFAKRGYTCGQVMLVSDVGEAEGYVKSMYYSNCIVGFS